MKVVFAVSAVLCGGHRAADATRGQPAVWNCLLSVFWGAQYTLLMRCSLVCRSRWAAPPAVA